MPEKTAEEIRSRFRSEQEYIREYVEAFKQRFQGYNAYLWNLNETLDGHGLPQIRVPPLDQMETEYTQSDIDATIRVDRGGDPCSQV